MLQEEDVARRCLIEQIMCGYKTDVSAYPEVHEKLKELAEDHIIAMEGTHIHITPDGWPFVRIVASCFDSYYTPQEQQHARAV